MSSLRNSTVKVIEILQRNNLNHLGNQLELYLYGHRSLNLIDSRKILLSTIKYIKDIQHSQLKPLPPPPTSHRCLLQPYLISYLLSYYYCIGWYIFCYCCLVYFWFAMASTTADFYIKRFYNFNLISFAN